MEHFQQSKLYEYGANSNLVLEAERDTKSRRNEEGKGEVESLNGKLNLVRMGDKLNQSLLAPTRESDKKRGREEYLDNDSTLRRRDGATTKKGINILTQTNDLDKIGYVPKTKETRIVYEEFLRLVQVLIGNQPEDVLKGASDEVLITLKDESMRDSAKQNNIEKILGKMKSEQYYRVVTLGKGITDYNMKDETEEVESAKVDEEMAVVFDDEEDDLMELGDDGDEEDHEEVEETHRGSRRVIGGGHKSVDVGQEEEDSYRLDVHAVDAHWLQRQLSKYYTDANISSQLAEECLAVLKQSDERLCENGLVLLLDFDKFELIKLLLKNRAKIYFCSKLRQSQTDQQRAEVEAEMAADPSGEGYRLLQLIQLKPSVENWTTDRIGEFADKARREARALIKHAGGGNECLKVFTDEEENPPTGAGDAPYVSDRGRLQLDDLVFTEGSHLMTNKQCELPDKSWRAQKKGYEEVHVPALRPVVSSSERLVEIADLPEWVQPAFASVRSLNRVQSKMVDAALYGSENILLCAPTGAGKTNVALLCMLNLIGNHRLDDGSNGIDLDAFKIVYIAPMKALVQECVQSFGKRLEPFGIKVRELSGDQNLTRQQIQDTQVIVTTPEKWDIITRKAGDRTYTQLVRLVIVDEIHLLHDERGPVLESLVARIIRQVETTQDMVRLVGLSATLPNYEDVAAFLRVNEKGLFFFDNSYRPVPLQQQYIGITEKKALKRFQLMNEICYEKVLQQAGKNQVLIFTHSRAETAKTAAALRDLASSNDTLSRFVREDSASLEILKVEAETAKNADLRDLLPYGFAIHHAGMVRSDRTLVEDLFADKHVQVLVSTATLAWGVNLPCHTVIIKGTQMYSPEQGCWVELSPLDVMQMLGRAGRYGLDSEGEGIIMTAHSELQYYLSLMNQQLPIESQFIKKLPDMLNAEIVLGAVASTKEAASWLGYTYLYVRMLRNPVRYGVSQEEFAADPTLLQRRIDLIHAAATLLDKHGLIKYDRKSGLFVATTLGRVASHYYVSHDTIQTFNENMKPSMSEIELFRLFSLAGEFRQIHVRDEEKLELSKLIARVPIPVKEGVEEPSAKVNVLLQAYISRLALEGFALISDMTYVQQSACRLMRAIFEIALKRGWAALTAKSLALCKMVERRTWASQSPLRQFGSIPEVIVRKLEKNSDISWERYYDLKPADLGEMVKIPKMGKTLYKFVHMFPKLLLNAHILPITRSLLKIDLSITADFEFDTQAGGHDNSMLFWVLVEDVDGETILHHEAFILHAGGKAAEASVVNFSVQMQDPLPPQYFIKIVSDRWLHAETVLPISFRHLILPQKFMLPTELLDLQPKPVASLNSRAAAELFSAFQYFNPIQTQAFSCLYESNENVLVCAPTSSGKTVCAELAILRMLDTDPLAKCVYVAPRKEIADAVYGDWSVRLSRALQVSVVLLTGETAVDLGLLATGTVVVSTAAHWDVTSRRWKQRKAVQSISLYLFDEMHLVGSGYEGSTFEIVVSRARYIASQLEKSVRIVGLSASLANAKDVGDWIGADANCVFAFSPNIRPVPLDIHIQSFETNHFSSRILAMAKPTYEAVTKRSAGKPAIIFVSSRKQAQLTAIDMLTFAAASGQSRKFLGAGAEKALAAVIPTIRDKSVAQMVSQGVGFLHSGMTSLDRSIVEALLRDGVIQVLVVPHTLCWSVTVYVHLVVVVDTVYYEGREHRFVDYGISDILQMIGRASRQGVDQSAQCVVLCHSPKRDYLKKLLHDPLPVESHLDHHLHDHLNAEVVTKTVENKSDAVDYLTWTLFYRRLIQNPNYYNLLGVTHRHLSDHLSELVESTLSDLEESKCLAVEDDVDLLPLNLGMIASYYYIEYTTIELFASSVTAKTKTKGVLDILSAASEFSRLTIRQGEEQQLQKLSAHVPHATSGTSMEEPSSKAFVLLQCHLSRFALGAELAADQECILRDAVKLLQALVDVVSSQGWLRPALAAMEVTQMIVQGLWNKDSVLLQIPHFTADTVRELSLLPSPVETVFDLLDMDDSARRDTLRFSASQLSDIAKFCNSYPNVEVSYEVDLQEDGSVEAGDSITLEVSLRRDSGVEEEEDDQELLGGLGRVVCPRFPAGENKREGWWLVVGDPNSNSLLTIKRVSLLRGSTTKLEFTAPELPGDYNLLLYVMCDSYLGCDQEYEFNLCVTPATLKQE